MTFLQGLALTYWGTRRLKQRPVADPTPPGFWLRFFELQTFTLLAFWWLGLFDITFATCFLPLFITIGYEILRSAIITSRAIRNTGLNEG